MPRLRFGTDGLRGVANADLTPELALALGRAAARVLGAPEVLIGRDTRRSGPLLQSALAAGFAAEGAGVLDLGVLPTAGVAYCAATRGLPAAMVSASHNPFGDNGIKLFDAAGIKLDPATEHRVEGVLDALLDGVLPDGPAGPSAVGERVGTVAPGSDGVADYRAHLVGALDGRRLDGLRVVVDCANGAASAVAPDVVAALGAVVVAVAAEPNGTNINHGCGSTHPMAVAAAVLQHGADLGLAFDGDADRLIAVDHGGDVVDGDTLLALFAVDMAERGELPGNAVVTTVMSNLGFHHAMAHRGIAVRETPVGDRQVLAALDAEGLALGGEQSGHIVFRHRATTGDGILTGLLLADAVVRAGQPLADLAGGLVERVPQVLLNVTVPDPRRLDGAGEVWETVAAIADELGDAGRVLLRPSGTEPFVRVMVEAPTEERATDAANRLAKVVEGALGG